PGDPGRRGRGRGAHRALLDRRSAGRRLAAGAHGRVRRARPAPRPAHDRRRGGSREGGADPRGAAGRSPQHAGDRRRHRRRRAESRVRGGGVTAPLLLGIDVGTTRTKVGLIGADGELVGLATAHHALDTDPASGRAEQDPEAWWAGLGGAVREATLDGARRPDGICVVGHGPTLTAVDGAGRAVRPAITWLDSRASREQAELEAATGLRGWALGVLP